MDEHLAPSAAATSLPQFTDAPVNDLVERDVNCPMCEYNLRGLIEPRCPECGFTFLWVELLDPSRWVHPYVFEHHPRRNLWSFFRTLIGGLRPGRFWDSLMPSQPSNPGRLRLYCTIVILVSFAGVLGELVGSTVAHHSFQGQAATLQTWRAALRTAWSDSEIRPLAVMALVVPVWALLTYWTMMIFGTSMHIAKVNPSHVFRCVVYCLDICLWCGVFVAIVALLPVSGVGLREEMLLVLAGWATAMSVFLFAFRMCLAYRLYMRFNHAIATVIATQVIVGLVVINVLIFWLVSRRGG